MSNERRLRSLYYIVYESRLMSVVNFFATRVCVHNTVRMRGVTRVGQLNYR